MRPAAPVRHTFPGGAQPHYQLVQQVLSLGAQMFRWPVSASSVNAIILEDSVASAGFEASAARPARAWYAYFHPLLTEKQLLGGVDGGT